MGKVLLLLLLSLATGSALAAPVPKEHRKPDDKARILGTWEMLQCNVGGRVIQASWNRLNIDSNGSTKATLNGAAVFEYFTTLDTSSTPRRMPWHDKPNGQVQYECVYGFKGDKLMIVVPHDHHRPPDSLEPGPRVTVYEFKRAEK